MIPIRCAGNSLQNAVLVLCLTLSIFFTVNAHAADEKVVGKEVADGTDTSANSDTPLPDLFTGTMSYRIPIEVPPGRRGVDPGIVLTYRSTNGNGWLGVGWELEMGSIERSTKGGVNYDASDFLLRGPGGVTELVNLPGTSEYRAKIEGNFIRFINYGTYWEAIDKKGVRFRFGHEPNTTVYDPNKPAHVFKWCLDLITDTNGNYVTLNYTPDRNQLYLNEIDYTGNDPVTHKLPPTNSVKFILEDRNDAPTMYTTNFAVTTAKRLKTIEVWSNYNTVNTQPLRVRKYELNYDADSTTTGNQYSPLTNRSVLGTVTEYGSDGTTTKPPITLGYSNGYTVAGGTSSGGWSLSDPIGVSMPLPVGMYCIPGKFGSRFDILCSTGSTGWDLKYLFNNLDVNGISLQWLPDGNKPTDLSQDSLGHQCVTGDFNGEGKNALACNFANNGDWTMVFPGGAGEIWTKETWHNAPTVLPITQCFGGDFDGNGKSDFACYASNTWKMALSTGSAWGSSPVQWSDGPTTFTYPTNNCLTGDFDGDGKTDFACNSGNTSTWNMYLSNGNGWTPATWYSNGMAPDFVKSNYILSGICMTGDYNGDGKTDIACASGSGLWNVQLSTGSSWDTASFSMGGAIVSFPINTKCLSGDFNGDGKTDISCYTSGGIWSTALSLGNGWNTLSWDGGPSPETSVSQQCFAGDYNADGKTDIVCYPHDTSYPGGAFHWESGYANAPLTDLLTHVSNGLGGEISVSYSPSSWYAQLPFTMQLISSVSVSDGNNNTSTSNYSYSGGYYNFSAKDFRGFNSAKVIGPGKNNELTVTETWFHQGDDTAVDVNNPSATVGFMKGKPYRTRISDGQGKVYSETETSYSTYTSTPYNYSPATKVDTYICDGQAYGQCRDSGSARQTRTVYYYDDYLTSPHANYGNVTREDRYGDIMNPANVSLNMTIERQFSPNVTNWIVSLPATVSVFQGIGDTNIGTNLKVSQTDYYYDDFPLANCSAASQYNHTPTNGNLTVVSRWLNGGNNSETRTAYDGYGNPVCTRDPNGNVTTTGFDTIYQTFPVSSTNAKTQTTTSAYYGVGIAADNGRFGQLKSISDPNNATITAVYDVFGRKTKDIQPDLFSTSTAYNSFGTVGSQNVYTYNQLGMWSASYFDGLGRTFKVRKSGPDNKVIVTETVYDQRGKVNSVSAPYFEGVETPVYRTYTYDPMGRVTRTTNPDNTFTLACYNDLVSVFIDENGHRRRETRDALGRLVTVEEYTGTSTTCDTTQNPSQFTLYATTTYTYDVLGNLTDVIDANQMGVPVANQKKTHIEYDTLGRKKNMTDPDMGYWEYSYPPVSE